MLNYDTGGLVLMDVLKPGGVTRVISEPGTGVADPAVFRETYRDPDLVFVCVGSGTSFYLKGRSWSGSTPP